MAGPPSLFEREADGIRLVVRLTPRGGRDAVEGWATLADGRTVLRARVRAAPENGAANRALQQLIAEAVAVSKSSVAITAGASARTKVLRIEGNPVRLAEALGRIVGSPGRQVKAS
jgi:uncharacterized protein YggU (UPF0235/DUF167 family)